jgi:hypothetical protein
MTSINKCKIHLIAQILFDHVQRIGHKILIYAQTLYQILDKVHLFNKRGGGAKNAKSLNVEVGINVEGGKI